MFLCAAFLAPLLAFVFIRSFSADLVHFSNDGPLAGLVEAGNQLPQTFFGAWFDLNALGSGGGSAAPCPSALLRTVIGPVAFAKFFPVVALFILGLGVAAFLRSLKLSAWAVTLGMLAAVFNSSFFGGACWGVAQVEIAFGLDFFALALVMANDGERRLLLRGTRLALAGLCVGTNVIEAADVGALASLFVAAFVFFKALTDEGAGVFKGVLNGAARVGVVAVFAGFIALQTVSGLIFSSVQGVAGTGQDTQTKAQHWDFATQWSLPKVETLGLFVPGLFGYRLDTPKDMAPAFQEMYEGGVYWGGVGRDPANDRHFDAGGQWPPPRPEWMRFTGRQNFCGVLVSLVALWAIAGAFRKENSPFTRPQKKLIWFWTAVLAACLLLAWGRFAPMFYGLLYQLPYFSTIRNPDKFLFFFSWAMVVLFAYGVHALGRQLDPAGPRPAGWTAQLKIWWARAGVFDRRWVFFCGAIFGASVAAWLVFASQKTAFVQYLQKMGFQDEGTARAIAAFSLAQAGWFLVILAAAILLLVSILAGYFSGARSRLGIWLLGAFVVADLVRADLPFVIHWDYKQKYEVGTLNPIVEFLRNQPYEHRVAGLPFRAPQGLELFGELYRIEWAQHHFLYYNIQSLDIVQMPRMPENLKAYLENFAPRDTPESLPLIVREWELTNTRYLLGAAGYLDVLNQQLDSGRGRFRIVQRFSVALKPGVSEFHQRLEELTAYPNENGEYAIFDFTGALPRMKLYSNWQVNTNGAAVLKTLADLNFNPAKTVLVSTPEKNLPDVSTNTADAGTVQFKSYAPTKIVFTADAKTPAVLLLNDKYDPDWKVAVDGRPAPLLRCNYIMRGVPLAPGQHTVEFVYTQPLKPLFITVSAIGTGLLLCGVLVFFGRRKE